MLVELSSVGAMVCTSQLCSDHLLQTQQEKEKEKAPPTSEAAPVVEPGGGQEGGEETQELRGKVKALVEEKRSLELQLEAFRQVGKDEREKAEILAAEKKYRMQVCTHDIM